VFDGTKAIPYTEEDQPNPINVYGRSKLMGEQAVQSVAADHIILRTSWVYSARGNNFLRTILRLAQEREELSIVADQIGSPTWARLIAESTAHVVRQSQTERSQGSFQADLYHLTSAGETSWFGFAQAIVEQARQMPDCSLKLKRINAIPTSDYPTPAQRPANSRLVTKKTEVKFCLQMPLWKIALSRSFSG
jgi:dTDP-4-dehydrorhamnose reductase